MARISLCVLTIVIVGLVAVTHLQADNGAQSREVVWVGVTVLLPSEDGQDYLIGTIDKEILEDIETGEYDRTFLRISNLRIEDEQPNAAEGARATYLDCADEYDSGIIFVRYENVLSIELKTRDPLQVQ